MKDWEVNLDGKVATLASSIKLNTDRRVEMATKILKYQPTNIHTLVGCMALEFQLSNQRTQRIDHKTQTSSTMHKQL